MSSTSSHLVRTECRAPSSPESTLGATSALPERSIMLLDLPVEMRRIMYDAACAMEADLFASATTKDQPRHTGKYTKAQPARNAIGAFHGLSLVSHQVRAEFLPVYLRAFPPRFRSENTPKYMQTFYPAYNGSLASLATADYRGDVIIQAYARRDTQYMDITPFLHLSARFTQFKLRLSYCYGSSNKFSIAEDINTSLDKQANAWRTLASFEGLRVCVHTFLGRVKVYVGNEFSPNLVWPGTEDQVNSLMVLKRTGLPEFKDGDGWSVSLLCDLNDEVNSELVDDIHRRYMFG